MSVKNSRLTLLAASVAAVLSSAQAGAQAGAPQASNELDEIVVTARQREEKLVDVPVTITAFTATDIQQAGIERPQDFIALTSGVSQVQTAEVGDMQVSIRGINTGRDAETNFALVIDGVLQTNPNGFNQEFANVQQIEVLKGPQGALYGRNAVGGAMIITTKKPGDAFEADASVGFGNHKTKKASVYLGGPLADGISAGVGAYYRDTDGFFNNRYLNRDDISDRYKEWGVTPRLIFKVGETGTIDIKGKYSKVEAGAINFNAAFALPAFTGFGAKFYENVNDHTFEYINNIPPQNEQKNANVSVKGDWDVGVGTLTAWVAHNDQKNFFLTDGTSAAFGLYAANPVCGASITAQPGAPLPAPTFYAGAASILPPYSPSSCDGFQYQQRDQKDTSVEIRLTSPGDQAFRWQGGAYYGDIKRRVVVAQGFDPGINQPAGVAITANPSIPARALTLQSAGALNTIGTTDLLFDDDFKSKVAAVFGQVAYDVAPNVEVALAARYDREKRSVDNNVPKIAPQTAGFGPFGAPLCPTGPATCTSFINPFYNLAANAALTSIPSRDRTFSQFQPKLSVNWKVTDDVALFASYGYGFRSGGFNSSGSAATVQTYFGNLFYVNPAGTVTTQQALPVVGASAENGVSDEYKKEVSKAAEVGFKASLLDRSLSINGSVYYTKIDDMQVFNFFAGPFGLLRVVTNIDQATVKGVELDARWKTSQYVTLFAGFGTVDGKIDKYTGRPYTKGNEIPYAPKYTANAGVDFTVPVGESVSFVARIDGSALGKTWFSPVQRNQVQTLFGAPGNYDRTERKAFALMNARLGFQGDNWSATAWSRNVTDKKYLAEVIPAPEFGGSFIHSGTGRAVGIDFSYKFAGAEAPIAAPTPAPAAALAPAPAPVAAVTPPPPPVDSDKDGVYDSADKCPGTPANLKVDANGCEIEELVLRGVNFATGKADLTPSSSTILDGVAATLAKRPNQSVEIRGYTDNVGNVKSNEKLSERRAQAVVAYLTSKGIPAGNLSARGMGPADPVADNATQEGRAENRRVTVKFKDVVAR